MKSFVFSLFVLFGLLGVFSSCDKDDDEEVNKELILSKEMVVGTWDVIAMTEKGGTRETVESGKVQVIFNQDNTYQIKNLIDGYNVNGTYTINKNVVTATGEAEDEESTMAVQQKFDFIKIVGNKAYINYYSTDLDVAYILVEAVKL
ncbi:MAG: DUF5004 domain-containing protein [Bacteroidales bacterium]